MINKFITDNNNIYLVYIVDGHIYRSIENIRILAENIKLICTSFRNG